MSRARETGVRSVCDCRHLAEAHEVTFQTIHAVKRGRCTVEGCPCLAYIRNPRYRVLGD